MDTITLSRLSITGSLNDSTPLVVITEICQCHGIPFSQDLLSRESYISELISTIYTHPVYCISPIFSSNISTNSHLVSRLSQFINPNWDSSDLDALLDAFYFIQRFMGDPSSAPLPSSPSFPVGLATPSHKHSYNACMLYKLCKFYSLRTSRQTSLDDLALRIRLLLSSNLDLSQRIITRLSHVSKSQLVNTLLELGVSSSPESETSSLGLPPFRPARTFSMESLSSAHTELRDSVQRWKRVQPLTPQEAIVLAAVNYKIDLSSASDPLLEYTLLSQQPYVPSDPQLRERLLKRGGLSLLSNFNPLLPACLYSESDLRTMALHEGYTYDDFRTASPYELLQLAYLSNTFYHGRPSPAANRETPFSFEPIDSLHEDLLLSFGSRADPRGLIVMRYSELASHLTYNRNFLNPFYRHHPHTGETFESLAIRKLKLLTQITYPGEPPEAYQDRRRLHNILIEIEIFQDESATKVRELFTLYHQSDDHVKAQIRHVMIKFFELSMYMRGWSGTGPYPISEAPVDNQLEVDTLVTQALSSFENLCSSLGTIGTLILNLPLLRYNNGIYQPTSDPAQGLTISDRLNLIKQGENTTNTNSCIRLSSNYLASSAHRYFQVLGMSPPFDIEHLRYIQ